MALPDFTESDFDSLASVRSRREKRRSAAQSTNLLIQSALSALAQQPQMGSMGRQRQPTFSDARMAVQRPVKSAFQGVSSPAPQMGSGPAEAVLSQAIQKMIAESGGRIKIVSGKRSSQRQAQLYAAALKKYGSPAAARKWVAPPGRSKHERGEAFDLGGDINLAARLAAKYGLHRPMKHEPWHFELIGSRGGSHKGHKH